MQKLLPKTEQCLNHIEELYGKYAAIGWDTYDSASADDSGECKFEISNIVYSIR